MSEREQGTKPSSLYDGDYWHAEAERLRREGQYQSDEADRLGFKLAKAEAEVERLRAVIEDLGADPDTGKFVVVNETDGYEPYVGPRPERLDGQAG